jgi:2-C-methyl-D-erythritol 4-phosphate cytidylyltransferase
MQKKRTVAVILAGGIGTRFGHTKPKQFFNTRGEPMIVHSVRSFLKFLSTGSDVVVIVPKGYMQITEKIIKKFFPTRTQEFHYVYGGSDRISSQLKAIDYADKHLQPYDTLIFHDAARPLLSSDDLEHMKKHFEKNRLDVCFVSRPLPESLFQKNDGSFICRNRDEYVLSQTPFFHTASSLRYMKSRYNSAYAKKHVHKNFHLLELVPARSSLKIGACTLTHPNTKATTKTDISIILAHLKHEK